jgi:hypothetical protein
MPPSRWKEPEMPDVDYREENARLLRESVCGRCGHHTASVVIRNMAGDITDVVCGYCLDQQSISLERGLAKVGAQNDPRRV